LSLTNALPYIGAHAARMTRGELAPEVGTYVSALVDSVRIFKIFRCLLKRYRFRSDEISASKENVL
jgi:hypothetical protein